MKKKREIGITCERNNKRHHTMEQLAAMQLGTCNSVLGKSGKRSIQRESSRHRMEVAITIEFVYTNLSDNFIHIERRAENHLQTA